MGTKGVGKAENLADFLSGDNFLPTNLNTMFPPVLLFCQRKNIDSVEWKSLGRRFKGLGAFREKTFSQRGKRADNGESLQSSTNLSTSGTKEAFFSSQSSTGNFPGTKRTFLRRFSS